MIYNPFESIRYDKYQGKIITLTFIQPLIREMYSKSDLGVVPAYLIFAGV